MNKKFAILLCAVIVSVIGYVVFMTVNPGLHYTSSEFRALSRDEQKAYIRELSSKKPKEAWAILKESFVIDGKTMENAHDFAHIVGNDLYKVYGFDGIKYCDATFSYGCFHGVTEEGLAHTGPQDLPYIEKACIDEFPPEKGEQYQSCIHGTGHGLFSFEGGDMTKALHDCDVLSPNYRSYCYDGVFMENAGENEESGIVLDTSNPWGACENIEERYKINCARYQIPLFLSAGGEDPVVTAGKYCALGPQEILKSTCYENLGYYVAQQNVGSAPRIILSCQRLGASGSDTCMAGAGIESVFQRYVSPQYSKSEFCDKIKEPNRSYCRNRVDSLAR